MDNLETLALAKAVDAKALKAARAEIEPGTYAVDTLVRVAGGLKVGEDYSQAFTNAAKPLDLFLEAVDALAGHITDALLRRIEERAQDTSPAAKERRSALKDRTWAVLDAVRDQTTRTAKGKVTTTLTAEVVRAEVSMSPVPDGEPSTVKA